MDFTSILARLKLTAHKGTAKLALSLLLIAMGSGCAWFTPTPTMTMEEYARAECTINPEDISFADGETWGELANDLEARLKEMKAQKPPQEFQAYHQDRIKAGEIFIRIVQQQPDDQEANIFGILGEAMAASQAAGLEVITIEQLSPEAQQALKDAGCNDEAENSYEPDTTYENELKDSLRELEEELAAIQEYDIRPFTQPTILANPPANLVSRQEPTPTPRNQVVQLRVDYFQINPEQPAELTPTRAPAPTAAPYPPSRPPTLQQQIQADIAANAAIRRNQQASPTSAPTATPTPAPTATSIPTPTPTPIPTPTHTPTVSTDPIDGYSIEHPPKWGSTKIGTATRMQGSEQTAYIEIEKTAARKDQDLVGVAEAHLQRILTRASNWTRFESKWRQGGINNSGPYIKLMFTRQKSQADCAESGEIHIFLSKDHPEDPAAFTITAATCPGNDLEQPDLWPYMSSFTEN